MSAFVMYLNCEHQPIMTRTYCWGAHRTGEVFSELNGYCASMSPHWYHSSKRGRWGASGSRTR